jgi:hypothetical protein
MRKERRIRILRRFVIGLAVAAVVAPAAQARFVELGGAKGSNAGSPVLQGDDKVIVPAGGSSTVLIHGDDKVFAPAPGDSTVLIHGDDKVIAPAPGDSTVLIHGDDKVIAPAPGDSTVLIHGDDKVIAPAPGDSTVLIHGDDKVIAPQTGDYTLASPNTFDWGDAFVGAGVVFALMLLAGGAALGTRRRARPTAA